MPFQASEQHSSSRNTVISFKVPIWELCKRPNPSKHRLPWHSALWISQ